MNDGNKAICCSEWVDSVGVGRDLEGVISDKTDGEGEGGSWTLVVERALPFDLLISPIHCVMGCVPVGTEPQHHLPVNAIVSDSMTDLLRIQSRADRQGVPFTFPFLVSVRCARARRRTRWRGRWKCSRGQSSDRSERSRRCARTRLVNQPRMMWMGISS